jgi:hypothetical protein
VTFEYVDKVMRVNVVCGSTDESAPDAAESGGDSIDVNWRTTLVCEPVNQWGWPVLIGLGTASILCACPAMHCAAGSGPPPPPPPIISDAAVVWIDFGGGMVWARHNNPDLPLSEAHPHSEAWRQLPKLVADGVYFSRLKLSAFSCLSFLEPAAVSHSTSAPGAPVSLSACVPACIPAVIYCH